MGTSGDRAMQSSRATGRITCPEQDLPVSLQLLVGKPGKDSVDSPWACRKVAEPLFIHLWACAGRGSMSERQTRARALKTIPRGVLKSAQEAASTLQGHAAWVIYQ